MIVHFLWIGNKVITYIWRAKTRCLFLFLLWAISFTSCETSPCRISKYLWGKLKQRNRGLEGTPCVSEPSPPLAPGHITQCLSSAVRTPSYNPSCAPTLALEVCSLQRWLLNWLDNVFQFPVKMHSWAVYAHLFLCQHCTLPSKDLFLPWRLTSWCIYREQWHSISAFVLLH